MDSQKSSEHPSKPDAFEVVDLTILPLKVGQRVMTLCDINQVPAGAIGRIIVGGNNLTVEWERVGHVVAGEPWIATKTVFNGDMMKCLVLESNNKDKNNN